MYHFQKLHFFQLASSLVTIIVIYRLSSTSFHKISATIKAHQLPNMEENKGDSSSIVSVPNVEKMLVLMSSVPKDGWNKYYEEGLMPWDLGGPTPVILHLLQTESLPKGRVLIPGCGGGHDVMAIASPERYVVGLDSSNNAINKAKQLSMSLSNANYLEFVKADFFDWNPTKLFDLFFDYTFFCAIEPSLRSSWASRIAELLKPDGELITLMFPISDHVGGPPFKVSVSDYEEVLHPLGFKAISVVDNDLAIGPRKGMEKLGRWKRSKPSSSNVNEEEEEDDGNWPWARGLDRPSLFLPWKP